ncbi:LPD29 domain-containing protein [Nocardia brasiliensis]|uniref:LPD29 domain-containing protein n=1 Tax=Nocardia brasiliensis TaxID=37326 RepID=UPI0037A9C87F
MPQILVDDRYRIVDRARRSVVRDGLSASDALEALDEILTQQDAAHHRVTVNRFWNHARLDAWSTDDGHDLFTVYRIIAAAPDTSTPITHLLRASLRKRWPAATFTVMPTEADGVSIRWVDGPDDNTVGDYLSGIMGSAYEPGPFTAVERKRILSLRGWQAVAALVSASLSIPVPRTADGDIDWAAADSVIIDGPAPVAGHHVCTVPGLLSVELGELLRHLADVCELTELAQPSVSLRKDPS